MEFVCKEERQVKGRKKEGIGRRNEKVEDEEGKEKGKEDEEVL